MRIERLVLERYGRFTDRTLTFRPDAAIHVVLGGNEAGKTTALHAIADLLFGFGQRTDYDFLHDGRSLRIGADLRLKDGTTLKLRRRKGIKNTLIDDSDQPLPNDPLGPVFGNLTREGFCREYALTSEMLRRGGEELLKAGGRLAETLAAGSAGLSALTALRTTLDAEAEALFTQRMAKTKPFYEATQRYAAADRQLREAIVTTDALRAAQDRVAELERQQEDLGQQHDNAGRDLRRLERCRRTRNALLRLDAITSEIRAFDDLPEMPARTIADWRLAHDENASADQELRKLEEADARDRAAIAALGVDEMLLSCGVAIDSLRERLGAIRKAKEDYPKRQEAQRQAQAELDDLARRLGLASHAELLARRPADPALERVRELAQAQGRANDRLDEAHQRLQRTIKNRDGLQSQSGNKTHAVDPADFAHRLEAVSHVPIRAERLARETIDCTAEDEALQRQTHTLNPPVESHALLAELPLPDEVQIKAHEQVATDLDTSVLAAKSSIEAAERSVRSFKAEIDRLTRDGTRVTAADLRTAREGREAAFDDLHAALDAEIPQRHAAFSLLRKRSHAADEVTDQLLSGSEQAARLQAARDQLADAEWQRQDSAGRLADLQGARSDADTAWQDLWAATGITPRSPSEMAGWRQRAQTILDRRDKLLARRSDLAALGRGLADDRTALVNLMEDFGRTPSGDIAADVLYREARSLLAALQQAWSDARVQDQQMKSAEADVREAKGDAGRRRSELDAIVAQWPAAVSAIGLGKGVSLVEAGTAVDLWRRVEGPMSRFERETRSVEGIELDFTAFDQEAAALASKIAPESKGEDAVLLLSRLSAALTEARNAAGQRVALQKAIADRQAERAKLQSRQQALVNALADARNLLGAGDDVALAVTIGRLEKRHRLRNDWASEAAKLKESADGLDERALRTEQEGIDPDSLQGEIERLTLHAQHLLDKIRDLSVAVDRARNDRDALVQGRDAAGAAREREEAVVELRAIAHRWLIRAGAARLASRAIERHRADMQDPLLDRTGQLLKVATASSFEGLAADYDDQDHPTLVAVRPDGARVPIPALSEGTRDQLFLALRLALLELRAAEPLPFIADDLLSSFDDTRALQTLGLLKNFGAHAQVIVLTHHAHVADLARQEAVSADVIAL